MSKNPKRRPKNQPPKTWNLTELLYAFVGVLTERKEPLIFSASHNCAPIAEFVAAFIKANNLPPTRPDYPKVKWPVGTDRLTNVPSQMNATNAPPISGEEAVDKIMETIRRADNGQTNAIVATVLTTLKKQHALRIKHAEMNRNSTQALLIDAMEKSDLLDNVIRGNYALLELKIPANG
jgi:hypothetical protein